MTQLEKDFKLATLSAQNTFTDWLSLKKGDRYTVSVVISVTATVTLQRTFDDVITIKDVKAYVDAAGSAEEDGICAEDQQIRLGIKTGDFGSGTAICRVGK